MDESRKQFEEWRMSDSPNSNLYRDAYGQYAEIGTWVAWKAWQASRAAIEIELPESFTMHSGRTPYLYVSEVQSAIRAAGIKVKE
ncbi:Phage protein [Enterobacter intestinihominis]